jgi:hypothetical protein
LETWKPSQHLLKRLESGTSNFPFPLVFHPFEVPLPTHTWPLFLKLLIYLQFWKPVARNFHEIIGFKQAMAGDTART